MEDKKQTAINLMKLSRALNMVVNQVRGELENMHKDIGKEHWQEVLSSSDSTFNWSIDIRKLKNRLSNNNTIQRTMAQLVA